MGTIITFSSVHLALKCEDEMVSAGHSVLLITTPRSVSSNCGFSVEIEEKSYKDIKSSLLELNIKYDGLYEKDTRDGVKYYAKKI